MERCSLRVLIPAAAFVLLTLAAPSVQSADTARVSGSPSAPKGVRYLYLIRHGMYDRDTTDIDRSANGLNALGREQARLVGQRLASLGVPITSFVTSDFTRARETADEIGRVLGMVAVEDSLIHECTPTPDRPEYSLYHTPEENARCDACVQAAWEKYARPSPEGNAHEVLVCHGNVIRWFVSKALGMDSTRWCTMEIANASLTVITVRDDGSTRLAVFSDVGHIPVEKQTWTGRGAGWHAPSRNAPPDSRYPAHWWAAAPTEGKPAWEILPQEAGPGEVILSKRNELGLLSNFAPTPFLFHGRSYASLEGFWQMMLYPEDEDDPRARFPGLQWPFMRDEVAQLTAFDAKRAGDLAVENMVQMGITWVSFEGERFEYRPAVPGRHYQLIVEATWAKVRQNAKVKEVLLATGDLVLKPDHHQEPNAPDAWRYYEILTNIRNELRRQGSD